MRYARSHIPLCTSIFCKASYKIIPIVSGTGLMQRGNPDAVIPPELSWLQPAQPLHRSPLAVDSICHAIPSELLVVERASAPIDCV